MVYTLLRVWYINNDRLFPNLKENCTHSYARILMQYAAPISPPLYADADAEDASMEDPSEELAASDCYPGQLVGSLPEGHHIMLPPLPEGITAATLAEAQIALDPSASGAWNAHFRYSPRLIYV